MRRTAVLTLSAVIGLLIVAYAWRQPLLTAVGRFLIVADAPRSADAIVVLSGSVPDRILEAVDLYKAQLAPRILLTSEEPLPGLAALRARGVTLPEHHDQNRAIAEQLGVPAEAIHVVPARAASTLAEAQVLRSYLAEHRIGSILLVTSNAHARRARMIFRHTLAAGVDVRVCPSRYDPFAAETWWQHRAFIRRLVIEYGKLLNFTLIDRWFVQPRIT